MKMPNNNMAGNKMVNGYQQFVNTNVPFNNNSMLSNNPAFFGNIRDPNFFNRVNMAKMEQVQKVKKISDLNLSKDQLTNYVICPIKVERMNKEELRKDYDTKGSTYINLWDNDPTKVPKLIKELWAGRKNTPYKNILKNESYTKEFKNIEDLLVHRYTQLDKDKIKLLKEFETLLGLLETHDSELKVIYSASEETKHKKQFEYITKYKHRIQYDPKNYNDLKKYYKREQKKINKENKRVDEMIELLIASEDLTEAEIELIRKETKIDEDIDDAEMLQIIEKGEKDLEKKLEKQLKKELGKDNYKQLMDAFNQNMAEDDDQPNESKKKVTIKSSKSKKHDDNHNDVEEKQTKKVSKKKNNDNNDNTKEEKLNKKISRNSKTNNDDNEKEEKITKKISIKNTKTNEDVVEEKIIKKVSIKNTKTKINNNDNDNRDVEEKPIKKTDDVVKEKKKLIIKPKENEVGKIDNEQLSKYKNRKV